MSSHKQTAEIRRLVLAVRVVAYRVRGAGYPDGIVMSSTAYDELRMRMSTGDYHSHLAWPLTAKQVGSSPLFSAEELFGDDDAGEVGGAT